MERMLNRMLRYADAIVKRGVDKLIDAIGHSTEPQTKNAETPQPQKRMGNDTDCAPQTTDNTTDCGLTEQSITPMDELCDIRYNVLDCTPEVQRRDQADKGFCAREQAGLPALPQLMWKTTAPALCYLCSLCTYVYRGKRHKGEQPLKEQNKACFFACVTLHHPSLLHNSLIFNMRYSMAQKSDEVRKNNEGGCTSLMRPPS